MIYRIGRFLFRLALETFFRRIELTGRSHLPDSGPVLLTPNHNNSLIDPLLILIRTKRQVSVTAKNTLAANPLLGWLMRAFRVIPIHRRQDVGQGSDPRKNVAALGEIRRRLAQGGAVCLFPEGQSHSDPQLRRFRHGAARVALDYLDKETAASPLKIVPVGLNFTAKNRFRSDAWIRFGPPIDVAAWRAEHPEAKPAALSAEIERRVRDLTLNFERRREEVLFNWAAEVIGTRGERPPRLMREPSGLLEAHVTLVERLQEAREELKSDHSEQLVALRKQVRAYRTELRRLGVRPDEVYISTHPARATLFVLRELTMVLIGLPMFLWGAANHLAPYLLVRVIAPRVSVKKDQWATGAVFPGLAVFSIFYLAQIAAAWVFLSTPWALAYTLALPASGVYALRFGERIAGIGRRTRTFILFVRDRALHQRLMDEGRRIIEAVRGIAGTMTSETP